MAAARIGKTVGKRVKTHVFNREKLKRLVHYVIWRAGEQPDFGATKLNKLLWFADARACTLRGAPITGAVYIREKFGPVAKDCVPIREELAREGAIRVTKDRAQNKPRTRFSALRPPDTSIFTPDELQDVDFWIGQIDQDHAAGSTGEPSHDYAWKIAKIGEALPFHAVFANRIRQLTGEEKARAEKRARELGLHL